MSEEKLAITPTRGDKFSFGLNVAHIVLGDSLREWWAILSEDLEQDCVLSNVRQVVWELPMIFILKFKLLSWYKPYFKWPNWLTNFITLLIKACVIVATIHKPVWVCLTKLGS